MDSDRPARRYVLTYRVQRCSQCDRCEPTSSTHGRCRHPTGPDHPVKLAEAPPSTCPLPEWESKNG